MSIILSFIFGILGASGALFVELVLSNLYFIFSGQEIGTSYFERLTPFLVLVVLIEESFKYLMLLKLHELHGRKGILTIILFGLGFASIEMGLAFSSAAATQDLSYILFPIAGVLALHTATSAIIGYHIFSGEHQSLSSAAKIIFYASCLHFAYNLMIIYS